MVDSKSALNLYAYPKAALGKRILAYILDLLIGGVPVGIFLIIGLGPLMGQIFSGRSPGAGSIGFLIALIIVGSLWALFYSLCRDGFGAGQSWGKKAASLMVVNLESNIPCSLGKSVLRNVFQILISIVLSWIPALNFLAGGAEPIIAIIHEKGHRVGDMVAKTQVIEVELFGRALNSRPSGGHSPVPPPAPKNIGQPKMPEPPGRQSFSIGRSSSNNLVIDNPEISRGHARIDFNRGQSFITDLDSTHGTTAKN